MRRLCVYLSSGRSTYVGRPRLARVADAEKKIVIFRARQTRGTIQEQGTAQTRVPRGSVFPLLGQLGMRRRSK